MPPSLTLSRVKMYKLRFTKWEFDKHNRQSDMAFVIRKKRARDAQRKKSTFVVRSKQISVQEVDRYVERKRALDPAFDEAPADKATPLHILCLTPPDSPYPEEAQDTLTVLAGQNTMPADSAVILTKWGKRKRTRSPSPTMHSRLVTQRDYRRVRAWAQNQRVPALVTTPDVLRRPEMLFGDIRSYIEGSVGCGTWYLNRKSELEKFPRTTVHPNDFHYLCTEAIDCFKWSSAVQGRRLLSKAFSLLPALLREEHPRLLDNVMDILLLIRRSDFVEICPIIQNHVAELARTLLPEKHIWRRICISLSHSDSDHVELLRRCWSCLIDTLAHASGRFSYNSVLSEVNFIEAFYWSTDPELVEQLLRRLLAVYEQTTEKLDDTALYIMDRLAGSMHNLGRDANVESLLEDVMLRARETGCLSLYREARFLAALAWAQYMGYEDDLAEENVRRAIALHARELGNNHPEVIGCCRQLEKWLRQWRREAEANQLSAKIDEMIGPDDIEMDTALMTVT